MKKITILAICLFVAVVGANAQVALGVKGGLNFANNASDAFDNPDSKTGYHFGAFAEIGLGGIAIQPELLFSTKGSKLDDSNDFDLSYLEVPILIKKNFLKVLNIHAGPQFGILTKADLGDEDFKDKLKKLDLSLVAGAGVNLPLGLVGGVRYVWGLTDLGDNDDIFDSEVKNRTFQVYVGWKFAGN